MQFYKCIDVFVIFCVVTVGQRFTLACTLLEGYDFSALDGVPWEAHNINHTIYKLSVCQPLSDLDSSIPCGGQSAACSVTKDGTATSLGDFLGTADIQRMENEGVIKLTYKGGSCAADSDSEVQTVITFKCGKTLGFPVFLDQLDCITNFEWYTTVACKTPQTGNEVKCYTYNKQGEKLDLGPLIKARGGHPVTRSSGDDIYINVCRDINPDPSGPTAPCTSPSPACVLSGSSGHGAGRAGSAVTLLENGRLHLAYTAAATKGDDLPEGCTEAPTTNITFACPGKGLVSMSERPTVVFALDCHIEILWETEFACGEQTLTSDSCKLDKEIHGVDIDLTPLSVDADGKIHRYTTTGTNQAGTKTYKYFLSVCGGLGMECPDPDSLSKADTDVTSCQTESGDATPLGRLGKQKLRYSDGELVLTYSGGKRCHHSDFYRETIINFHCNETAGTGQPTYSDEDDCTYIFDWQTSLACFDQEQSCSVERDDGVTFDLSILTMASGKDNWQALRGYDSEEDSEIVLNVCDRVTGTGLSQLCPSGAAACSMVKNADWLSLGQPSSPVYVTETSQVMLEYLGGSVCPGDSTKKVHSVIRFSCKPGDLESPPVLVRKSTDGCLYEFEWATAAVCEPTTVSGDDCTLEDKTLGLTFDLRPLSASDPGRYEVEGQNGRKYYINVCAMVQGSPCNDGKDRGQMAACQIDTDSKIFSTGVVSSTLRYTDGILNLTYSGGDPYHSTPPKPRTTEIAFKCGTTKGKPEFFGETEQGYSFLWETQYACPEKHIDCVTVDTKTNEQYDLSSLALSGSDWITTDDTGATQRLFYINVCRGLSAPRQGCDLAGGVCEVTQDQGTESVSHSNLGQMTSGPEVVGQGEVILTYTNGSECEEDKTRRYTTKISVHCNHGATTTSPRLAAVESCQYTFEWDHAAACAITASEAQPSEMCTISDPALGYTFNLQPLSKKDYTVTHAGDEYKLHICGPVSGASCQRSGEDEPAVCVGATTLGTVSTRLEYSEAGHITLTYHEGDYSSTGHHYKTIIEFDCDLFEAEGKPVFKERDGDTYIFSFPTPYACVPAPVACTAVDSSGRLYDLSRLALGPEYGNWQVVDSRPGHNDLHYYINVCKPVNPQTSSEGDEKFCSGIVGACQSSSSSSYSLGYVQGSPVVVGDGLVTLRYTNGDLCHNNTNLVSYRSTLITFSCHETETDPVFITETPDCEYQFSWSTPLACPVTATTGDHCTVTDPAFHTTFDLTPLQLSGSGRYEVAAGDYEYWLNVCGGLGGQTEGECHGAAACQTRDGGQVKVNGGLPSTNLTYEDGEIRLVYKHGKDKCHDQYERETVISFTCDHDADTSSGLRHLSESPTCQYLFEWATPLACPPRADVLQCSYRDDGGDQYDLTGMRLVDGNYEFVDVATATKYLINVCGNVVHGKGAACPPSAAVCAVNQNAADKYRSLGSVSLSRLEKAGDMLSLSYSGGDSCSDGTKASTVIQLKCDATQQDTQPVLIDSGEGCHYVFEWVTSRACPLNSGTAEPGSDCTVQNPLTGHEFDLSSLKGRSWTLDDDTHNHKFDISVCGPLSQSVCGDNVASCQYEASDHTHYWSSGDTSSSLVYLDGVLRLEYTGGDVCHHNNEARSTVVSFVCADEDKGPSFVAEDEDCTYSIYWHTPLACETEALTCSVTSDLTQIDLSPLVLSEGSHTATTTPGVAPDNDASYYINLCRPLNPIPGVPCPANAAVCTVSVDGHAKSLGSVSGPPTKNQEGQVTVEYSGGASCREEKTWSSQVIFTCEPGLSAGTPELVAVNAPDCLYVFSWATYLVCEAATEPDTDNDCRFTDPRTEYTYDFSALKLGKMDDAYKVSSRKTGTYYINICSGAPTPSVSGCGANDGVCLITDDNTGHSYGSTTKVSFLSTAFNVKMNYGGGEICGGGRRETHILFECDHTAPDKGAIELSYEGECDVVLVYRTHLACAPVIKDCILAHQGKTYDLGALSRQTGSWQIQDKQRNYYWFNLCQSVHGGPVGCSGDSAVCWEESGTGTVRPLGIVQSQTMAVDTSGRIVVSYSGVAGSCRGHNRDTAMFKVYLKCGHGIGKPAIISSGDDPCMFELEWNTTFACRETREPVFERSGKIKDPKTGLEIELLQLSGGRTYTVENQTRRYVIQLRGTPAIDGEDCRGMAVCETRTDNADYHVSLGESSSAKYYIEGETLEAHYKSPTPCDPRDNTVKATSVFNFHCSINNKTESPQLLYVTKACQYVFEWYTPGVCELEELASLQSPDTSGGSSAHTVAIVIAVLVVVVLIAALGLLLYNPDRRARISGALRRLFRKPSGYTSYSYAELNQVEEDNTLMTSSQGRYGAEGRNHGNIQSFLLDSDDEDILQL